MTWFLCKKTDLCWGSVSEGDLHVEGPAISRGLSWGAERDHGSKPRTVCSRAKMASGSRQQADRRRVASLMVLYRSTTTLVVHSRLVSTIQRRRDGCSFSLTCVNLYYPAQVQELRERREEK